MEDNMSNRTKHCKRCDAEMSVTEKFCPNCKQPAISDALVSAPLKPVNCPVCKIPMYAGKVAGHDVLHCAECNGIALKREVIMKLQPLDKKVFVAGDAESSHKTPPFFEKREKPPFLICPACGKKMAEKKLGPMTVDMCTECKALWLDGEKNKHLNEIIGPYKAQALNQNSAGGRHSRR